MPTLKPVTVDRRTAKRMIQHMNDLLKLTNFSPFAKDLVGVDSVREKQIVEDIYNLTNQI